MLRWVAVFIAIVLISPSLYAQSPDVLQDPTAEGFYDAWVEKLADLPPLVIPGVPKAPPAFSGKEDPGAKQPDELINAINDSLGTKDAVKALGRGLLRFPQAEVRKEAANAIWLVDKKSQPLAILALRAALSDPDPGVRERAAMSLSNLRDDGAEVALGELVNQLDVETNREANHSMAMVIQAFGPKAAPAVPYLTRRHLRLMQQEKDLFYSEDISTFAKIGEASLPVVPVIVFDALNDQEYYACETLGRLGCEKELIMLMSRDKPDRLAEMAVHGAGFLPKYSPEVIERMIAVTENANSEFLRGVCLEALGKARPTNEKIVKMMIDSLLNSDTNSLRRSAAEALGNCEPKFPIAIDPLKKSVAEDGDRDVRQAAATALAKYPVEAESVYLALVDEAIRSESIQVAGLRQLQLDSVPAILSTINDAKLTDAQREIAVLSLQWVDKLREDSDGKKNWEPLVAPIKTIASDKQLAPGIRAAAMFVLRYWGMPVEPMEPVMLASINGAHFSGTRIDSMRWVESNADQLASPDQAIAQLIKATEDEKAYSQRWAANALAQMGQKAKPAIPQLLKLVQSENDYVSREAINAVAKINCEPKLCIATLLKVEDSEAVKAAATLAAADNVDAKPVIAELRKRLEEGDDDLTLMEAIQQLGPKSIPLIKLVIAQIEGPEATHYTADALLKMGPTVEDQVVEPLIGFALKQPEVASSVLKGLGDMKSAGPALAKAAPKLLADGDARQATLEALGKLAPSSKAALPAMAPLLMSDDSFIRHTALDAIIKFGPDAKPYLPQMKKMAENEPAGFQRGVEQKVKDFEASLK
ncbi:HEAT repeat domain-containing protein [Bremerella cremea]|uniref:HEAT repeat domain-containing protein n=1 Tax=Bremerella cremea TaxID=1031537 RepID=UPI0031EDF201